MAGPMGMVKLFVRNGVSAVRSVVGMYRERMTGRGMPGKDIAVAIVHHANLKINQLKAKQLQKEGIVLSMPWLLTDFGNVSAASAMIAFLRKLRELQAGRPRPVRRVRRRHRITTWWRWSWATNRGNFRASARNRLTRRA